MAQASKVHGQQLEDPPTVKFTWKIEEFTKLKDKKLYSDVFTVGDYKWQILVYPKGNKVKFLSIHLALVDRGNCGSIYAKFSLAVINQINTKDSLRKSAEYDFHEGCSVIRFTLFMALYELYDTCNGYLMNDIVIVEAVVDVAKFVCQFIPAIMVTSQSEEDAKHPHEMQTNDQILRRLSAAEELAMSSLATVPSATVPSAEALAALGTLSLYARSSLDILGKEGAYEELCAALGLLIEEGIIPVKINSVLIDLLKSLAGKLPEYLTTDEELFLCEVLADRRDGMKIEMELAIEKCKKKKVIVAELDAELARVNAKRAEAMEKLEIEVTEMEPLRQRFADISSKLERFIVKKAMFTAPKGTWDAVKVLLKHCSKF